MDLYYLFFIISVVVIDIVLLVIIVVIFVVVTTVTVAVFIDHLVIVVYILQNVVASDDTQEKGDLDAIKDYINRCVISEEKAVSMKVLHEIYGIQGGDSRTRNKLKKRIESHFTNMLAFIAPSHNVAEIVISKTVLDDTLAHSSNVQTSIKNVALHLPQEIVDYCEKLIPQKWPPTIEGLIAEDNEPPPNAAFFLRYISDGKHSTSASDNLSRLIDSFGADLIRGISRGKVISYLQLNIFYLHLDFKI